MINEDDEKNKVGHEDKIEIINTIADYDCSVVRFGPSSGWSRIVLELDENAPSEISAEFYVDGKCINVIEPQSMSGDPQGKQVWDIMYVHPEIGWIETNVFSDTEILKCDELISGFADLIRHI